VKKRQKKGGTRFKAKPKGKKKGTYTYEKKPTNAMMQSKAKPTNSTEETPELDLVKVPQAEQRLLISIFTCKQ
jgi:hypothetical protein